MGLLRDLVAARDLVTEVTRGLDEMGRAMAQVSRNAQAPLGPGGSPFGPFPNTPSEGSPEPAPNGLNPYAQSGTILLGPSGQPVSVFTLGGPSGKMSSGRGGGSGGGRRVGSITSLGGIGGSVAIGGPEGTMGTGSGGGSGGTLLGGITSGQLTTSLKGSVAEPVVSSLQEIRDELRAMRQEQRNATGLRAAGIA